MTYYRMRESLNHAMAAKFNESLKWIKIKIKIKTSNRCRVTCPIIKILSACLPLIKFFKPTILS
jgi:hypothetical protein